MNSIKFHVVVSNHLLDNEFSLNFTVVDGFLSGAQASNSDVEYKTTKKFPTKGCPNVEVIFSGNCPECILSVLKEKVGTKNPYVAIFRVVERVEQHLENF